MKVSVHKRSSTTSRKRRSNGSRSQFLRSMLGALIAIAFAAQALVAQTHIHGITQETLTELSLVKADRGYTKGKLPSLPDEKNCPLCRLAAFVGSCVVPLAVLALPIDISGLLPIPEPAPFGLIDISSHCWLVRAPPR